MNKKKIIELLITPPLGANSKPDVLTPKSYPFIFSLF